MFVQVQCYPTIFRVPTANLAFCRLAFGTRKILHNRIFLLRGGGYPPILLRVLGRMIFRYRGEGGPLNSVKENSAKKQVF